MSIRRGLALHLAIALLAAGAFSGCSATRGVRPVGQGNTAVGVSVGGPIFQNLGSPMPVPLMSAHVRHGIGERTDLDVGLHAPIVSAFGIDVGASHLLMEQKGGRPALSIGGRALLFADALSLTGRENPNTGEGNPFSVRVYEQLYGNVSWRVGQQFTFWTGLDLFAQVEQLLVRPSLVAGMEWRPSRRAFIPGITLEAKHVAFLTNSEFEVVDYVGLAGYGAFAVQLGLNFYLGDNR